MQEGVYVATNVCNMSISLTYEARTGHYEARTGHCEGRKANSVPTNLHFNVFGTP